MIRTRALCLPRPILLPAKSCHKRPPQQAARIRESHGTHRHSRPHTPHAASPISEPARSSRLSRLKRAARARVPRDEEGKAWQSKAWHSFARRGLLRNARPPAPLIASPVDPSFQANLSRERESDPTHKSARRPTSPATCRRRRLAPPRGIMFWPSH